ncbi:MAG: alpha/beta fold hydrolase [Cytophagales bacterium]|nr:alpha/beta fold hydrolase [Cytophagales bacterium]
MGQLLNYRLQGKGQTVILLHGLFGSMDNLMTLARGLAEEYQVLTMDLRNHGRSFHADSMTYQEMAEDVLDVIDDLKLGSVMVFGHSMGGKVAMQLALEASERIAGLVVGDIAPAAYPPHHREVLQALQSYDPEQVVSRQVADRQLSEFIDSPAVRQLLIKNLKKNKQGQYIWRINVSAIAQSYTDISAELSLPGRVYKGPTLFLKGEHSDYLQAEHQALIEQYFPDTRLRVISGAGHWLHADKPDLLLATLKRFLKMVQ